MKKLIKLFAAVGLALGLALSGAAAANATDVPRDETPTEVWWLLPDHGTPDNVTWDQPWLPNGEADLKPGECAQVDTNPAWAIPLQTADGILTKGEDYGTVISWRFVCAPDATQPPDESTPGSSEVVNCETKVVTITNWHDVITYTGDKYGYTASEPVRVPDEDTTRAADDTDCPPPVDIPEEEPECGTATTLACSGVAEDMPLWAGGAAAAILLGLLPKLRRRVG